MRKHKRLLIGILIAIVCLAGLVIWRVKVNAARAKAEEPEIELATVTRKDLNVTVSASGVIEAKTTVEVKSRSGGEVKRLFVEAGDFVKEGDLIAQMDPTDLRNQAEQVAMSVKSAKAQTTQARLQAAVQAAQTTGELDKAEAAVVAARASVAQAAEQLRQERESSQSALSQAEAGAASARTKLAQAKAQQQAQPALSNAEVESAQASLESARQNLSRLKAGNRPQEIAQAQASLKSAEANLSNAETALTRQEALLAKGFTSQQAVDDARKARDQAAASRDQAREQLDLQQAGSRAEDIAQAEAQVKQAEAALRQANTNTVQISLKEGDVEAARQAVVQADANVSSARAAQRAVQVREKQLESARASLRQSEATLRQARSGKLSDEAQKQQIQIASADLARQTLALNQSLYDLRYTNVYAPRTGVVMQKMVEEGTTVPAGTAALKEGAGLITMADTSEMFMLADVDESDMANIKTGQTCEISASVLPNQKFQGKVVKIFPQGVEEQSVVRFQVRLQVTNPSPALRPGMTADATIQTAFRPKVLVIPDTCITRSKGTEKVDVQKDSGEVEERTVKSGLSNYDETEIVTGLTEGEKVIVPPPPGTPLPPGMGGGRGSQQQSANRGRMMMQFRR